MAGCVEDSADPTATPTVTPTPTPARSKEDEPERTENLLVNGTFSDGLNGWTFINGYWLVHGPISCEETGTSYAEMDRDNNDLDQWPVGGEDWLWQDVEVTISHSELVFRMIEAHHMHEGVAEITIYGKTDSRNPWEVVFHRPEVESEFGTGKCDFVGPPEAFEYTIPVAEPYAYYRLELHGHMVDENDGFLVGGLELVLMG